MNEPFGRQLKPVQVLIRGGDREDRLYWRTKIKGYLEHQPCVTVNDHDDRTEILNIHPDANND
jgi:hypothetical protein